jgi:hypothetical protein
MDVQKYSLDSLLHLVKITSNLTTSVQKKVHATQYNCSLKRKERNILPKFKKWSYIRNDMHVFKRVDLFWKNYQCMP